MSHDSLDRFDFRPSGRWHVAGALLLVATIVAPSAVQAQGGQQKLLAEWRQVRQQLNQIRQQALQDSALQAQRQQLLQTIRSEMRAMDDSTAARVDSIVTLEKDLMSARQQQDTTGAMQAARQLKQLQKSVRPMRKQVMKRPKIQKRLMAFRKAVQARMSEIDPKTDSLRKRAAQIRAQLQGGSGGGGR